ncbi:MAG: ABC transporter substrate-binding protein [Pseudomonadota bacterium]
MPKIILSALILLFFTNPSFADEAKEVESFVNDLGNKIIKIADDKKLNVNQKRDQLIKTIDGVIDADWVSKFVLGKNYRLANPEQKEQFKKLYREFMINTYSPKFTGYSGEKFTISSITNDGNYYTAKCLFYPKDKAPIVNLDFRVKKNPDTSVNKSNFLVFDIVAEGVSLIETQRSEFGAVITKDGLDKFLADLKERNTKLKAASGKPSKTNTAKK